MAEDDPGRTAKAASAAMSELGQAMVPGARIADLQEKTLQTFRKMDVPESESLLTYFHGVGLSHADVEALVVDDGDPNWALQDGMVIAAHLLCPGDERNRCWIEEVFWIKEGGPEAFFTWGNDPIPTS